MTNPLAPPLEYRASQWWTGDSRHLELTVVLKVMPYVRQTRNTRWREGHPSGERARAYNEVRGALRDALAGILLAEGIAPFGKVRLGMASSFWVKHPATSDLGNYEKALEDAGNGGVLYPDDKYIYQRGAGGKYRAEPEHFSLHLWEL